ncbi:MAG: ACT domain-containing protein [Lentisphaerae bacterium]|nr:ACT domain-containing protein [Lentisphaerota bacterium]
MGQPVDVAFLGPEGTYSHLVAEKRFGRTARLNPLPTILDVCQYVADGRGRHGIIPIENSSGGAIHETVDILIAGEPRVVIREELSLIVHLALLGRRRKPIRTLFSHFAPLDHCAGWVRKQLPGVQKEVTPSTATAARLAAERSDAAALGSRRLASMYGLDVLVYPVEAEVPNITAFLSIGAGPGPAGHSRKTTLAAKLPNRPGALCTFLETFRTAEVNLSRIISRPVRGSPREYAFMVDIDGSPALPHVRRALADAKRTCVELRVVGAYPVRRPYKS